MSEPSKEQVTPPPSLTGLPRWEGGFPGEHEFSTLETLTPQPDNPELETFFTAARQVLDKWQGNHFAGLYLHGKPGTGKSHAAVALGRAMHEEIGAEVHYRYLPDLPSDEYGSLGSWNSRAVSLRDMYSVFPKSHREDLERNPKSVLILDDYRPASQEVAMAAIEAAAQFGGFVIMTSNYEDPFKLIEPAVQLPTDEQLITRDLAQRIDPETTAKADAARAAAQSEISDSFRSRVAAGIKFIEFTGTDHRIANNFWGD